MKLAKDGPSLRAGALLPSFCVAHRLRTALLVRGALRALNLGQNSPSHFEAKRGTHRQ